MTRLEQINFIRRHDSKHKDTNFVDYDDSDVYCLYKSIKLTPEKEKQRDGLVGYYLNRLLDKMHPSLAITCIMLFNPITIPLYCIMIGMLIYGHYHRP